MKHPFIVTIVLALLLALPGAFAQDRAVSEPAMGIIAPDYYPGTSVLENQHYYRVILDGEGEATVIAKIVLGNTGRDTTNTVTLSIPGQARLLSAIQEYQPLVRQCVRYVSECENGTCRDVCAQWYDQPQWPPTYYSLDAAQNQQDDLQLTLTLEQPLKSGESVTLLVAYKSEDYTREKLGAWTFDFPTISQDTDIGRVRVAISVSEDLYLDEVDSGIDYKSSAAPTALLAEAGRDGSQNAALADYSQSITYAQGLVKTAEALDPHERFRVEGKYSASYLALNLGKIAGWSLAIVALLAGLIYGGIALSRRVQNKKADRSWTAVLAGLLSAVAIIALFIAGWFSLQVLERGYYYSSLTGALTMLVMIVWVVLLLALFLTPPILIGIKYGALYGVLAAGITLGIVFVAALIGALVAVSLVGPGTPILPYY